MATMEKSVIDLLLTLNLNRELFREASSRSSIVHAVRDGFFEFFAHYVVDDAPVKCFLILLTLRTRSLEHVTETNRRKRKETSN